MSRLLGCSWPPRVTLARHDSYTWNRELPGACFCICRSVRPFDMHVPRAATMRLAFAVPSAVPLGSLLEFVFTDLKHWDFDIPKYTRLPTGGDTRIRRNN